MKTFTSSQWPALLLLLLVTCSVAWPWPAWVEDAPNAKALHVRQDDADEDSTSTDASTTTDRDADETETSSSDRESSTNDNENEDEDKDKDDEDDDDDKDKDDNKDKKPKQFDPLLPAGGVALQTPDIMAGSTFYRIGDQVTFGWNYTSLLGAPAAVNVVATCTANNQLYEIAMNQTFRNASQSVTWDTGAYQETNKADPLLTEVYTLIIYDAEKEIDDTADSGYLAPFNQYQFGMYTPQKETPMEDFVCATCSGALSDTERSALKILLGTTVITVMSFTWFVSGTGVF